MNTSNIIAPTVLGLRLGQLVASPRNVRTLAAHGIKELALSIRAVGLLQNLVVVAVGDGTYEVVAGGRRLAALFWLQENGEWNAENVIECQERSAADATTVSLTENDSRLAMNPAERFAAYTLLAKDGMSVEQIADAFGIRAKEVERYLAMDRAAPELLALLRENGITTEQLGALCSNPDHEIQMSAWRNAWGSKDPRSLRHAVTAEELDASKDRRVAFIGGVEAYTAAGGSLRADLFSGSDNAGFITDVALLDRLVMEKLNAAAEAARAEGWKWVQIDPSFDFKLYDSCGRVYAVEGALTAETAAAIEALTAEDTQLDAEHDALHEGEGEFTEADEARVDEIDERREAIEESIRALRKSAFIYSDDVKSKAGVIIGLYDGAPRIESGLVKTEDREAMKDGGARVAGGRENKVTGKKGDVLSDSLQQALYSYRNLAVQEETAKNVRVAKVLFGIWTYQQLHIGRTYGPNKAPCDFTLSSYGVRASAQRYGADVVEKQEAFKAIGLALVEQIDSKNPWASISALSDPELDQLLAYGIASSVSVDGSHAGMTGKLLGALKFDMANHFEATPANYLGRVNKEQMVQALAEAGKASDRDNLLANKKGALATIAGERLAGTGWVPAQIRTPAPKKVLAPKQANGHKATKKATAPKKGAAKAKAKPTTKSASKA